MISKSEEFVVEVLPDCSIVIIILFCDVLNVAMTRFGSRNRVIKEPIDRVK